MKLGSGGFGSVYKAVQDDVRVVAVKLAYTGEEGSAMQIEAFWKEAELLASLHDNNIVQFFGAAVSGVSLCHLQCTQSLQGQRVVAHPQCGDFSLGSPF